MIQSDTGEIIKVYDVGEISLRSNCPACGAPENDRIHLSATEAYCYCFGCALEWVVRETWVEDRASLKTYRCRATDTEYYSLFVKAESAEAALEIALETDMDDGWEQDRCGGEWEVEQPGANELPELVDDVPSHWDDDPDWPVTDWQAEVANDDTRQSYREWVESQREAAS